MKPEGQGQTIGEKLDEVILLALLTFPGAKFTTEERKALKQDVLALLAKRVDAKLKVPHD